MYEGWRPMEFFLIVEERILEILRRVNLQESHVFA